MADLQEDLVPGSVLERLVHSDPARIDAALEELRGEMQRHEMRMRPLASGNPAHGLLDPRVQAWNWGGFLAGPAWAVAHGLWVLGLLLLAFFWLFPLPNLLLGRFGGGMAWRQRRFASLDEFAAVQRAWALGGLMLFPLQIGMVVGAILLVLNR